MTRKNRPPSYPVGLGEPLAAALLFLIAVAWANRRVIMTITAIEVAIAALILGIFL